MKSRSLTPSHLQSLLPRPLPIRRQGPCWTCGTRRCEAAAGPAHARCRERLLNAAAALSPTCRTEGLSRFWRESEPSRLKRLQEASPQSRCCLLFTAVLFHARSPQSRPLVSTGYCFFLIEYYFLTRGGRKVLGFPHCVPVSLRLCFILSLRKGRHVVEGDSIYSSAFPPCYPS